MFNIQVSTFTSYDTFTALAKENKNKNISKQRIQDPHYWEQEYVNYIQSIINSFYSELQRVIQDPYVTDAVSNKRKDYILRFLSLFNPEVQNQVQQSNLNRIARGINAHQSRGFMRQMQAAGINIREVPYAGDKINEFVFNNTQRIKSLVQEEIQNVHGIIEGQPDLSRKELSNMIQEESKASVKQADRIARNEVLTLQGEMDKTRQQGAGFTKFSWETMSDQKVRASHKALDGKVFSWNDLPTINGVRVYPKSPTIECINCRCWASPVID